MYNIITNSILHIFYTIYNNLTYMLPIPTIIDKIIFVYEMKQLCTNATFYQMLTFFFFLQILCDKIQLLP